MIARRKFLLDCSTVVAGFTLVSVGAFSRPARLERQWQTLSQLSYSLLAAQVDTVFEAHVSPGRVVNLTLLKAPLAPPTPITPGKRLPGDAGFEKFSLIFSGPKETLLAPGIHQFEHEQLGRFEMFVGPIGLPDADSVRYEAGFNRPAPMDSSFETST